MANTCFMETWLMLCYVIYVIVCALTNESSLAKIVLHIIYQDYPLGSLNRPRLLSSHLPPITTHTMQWSWGECGATCSSQVWPQWCRLLNMLPPSAWKLACPVLQWPHVVLVTERISSWTFHSLLPSFLFQNLTKKN